MQVNLEIVDFTHWRITLWSRDAWIWYSSLRILINTVAGRAIRQSKQKVLKLLLKTTEAFSFTMIQGREGWLKVKNFPGYSRSLALSFLCLSHLSSNQVPDSLFSSLYPKTIRKKNILVKNKNPQSDWNMSHSMSWGNQHFSCGENLSILMLRFQGASWPQFFNFAHKKELYSD